MRRLAVIGVLACGCVFPSDEPTGVELSWRFFEVNGVDGDAALRGRTCSGAGFEHIVLDLVQVGDETRRGNFDYDCETGYQTPAEFRTEASDAFIELKPADYAVVVVGIGTTGRQTLRELQVDVQSRGLTIEGLDLGLSTTRWTVELANTDECSELGLSLHYPDPATALAEPTLDEDGEPIDVLYRDALVSDRELPLSGALLPCAAELAGAHVFENVDQGPYRLDVELDGMTCAIDIDLAAQPDSRTVIDLANLPCGG